MPQHIQQGLRAIRDSPVQGERVELVLSPEEEAEEEFPGLVRELSINIVEELPFGMMVVEVDQSKVARLCEIDGLESVSFNEDLKIQSQGNRFGTPPMM